MVANISSSISTKVWDQAKNKLMASGSTIRTTTDCPSGLVIHVYVLSMKV